MYKQKLDLNISVLSSVTFRNVTMLQLTVQQQSNNVDSNTTCFGNENYVCTFDKCRQLIYRLPHVVWFGNCRVQLISV